MIEIDEVNADILRKIEVALLEQMKSEFVVGKTSRSGTASPASEVNARRDRLSELIDSGSHNLNPRELNILRHLLFDKVFSPLDALMVHPYVDAFEINGNMSVRRLMLGAWEACDPMFETREQLKQFIDSLIIPLGLHLDENCPMASGRLADGSYIEVTLPPVSADGPVLSVHKVRRNKWSFAAFTQDKTSRPPLTDDMAKVLSACAEAGVNIIVSGLADSGRTSMLNALARCIDLKRSSFAIEPIITIEGREELDLDNEHCLRLLLPIGNWKGESEVSKRILMRKALRMDVKRIILSDCAGPEACEILEAMANTHSGSMMSATGSNPRDCLRRIENLLLLNDSNMRLETARYLIATAMPIIVQMVRLEDGTRRVSEVIHVEKLDGDDYKLTTIFHLARMGRDERGLFKVDFVASGLMPRFLEQVEKAGIPFKLEWVGYQKKK